MLVIQNRFLCQPVLVSKGLKQLMDLGIMERYSEFIVEQMVIVVWDDMTVRTKWIQYI
jgi:hypothetical protein